jgi:hypothetical protein
MAGAFFIISDKELNLEGIYGKNTHKLRALESHIKSLVLMPCTDLNIYI